ncbi:MAG: hypothetical protein EGQ63_05245, partial [Clostridiales bacterium]|nr:hypothetical protein [Clostridiales bacterium]
CCGIRMYDIAIRAHRRVLCIGVPAGTGRGCVSDGDEIVVWEWRIICIENRNKDDLIEKFLDVCGTDWGKTREYRKIWKMHRQI